MQQSASSSPQPIPCEICGSIKGQVLYRPKHAPGPVVRCESCGLVYISPRLDTRALIEGGPVGSEGDAAILTSVSLGVV